MLFKKRQILGLFLAVLAVVSYFAPPTQSLLMLQEKQRISVGEPLEILLKFPPYLQKLINVVVIDGENNITVDGSLQSDVRYSLGGDKPVVTKPGTVRLELKLFGFIPLKEINVDVIPNLRLVPGGHSIGVLLRTDGVMVVGYSPVLNEKNLPVFPAREADVCIGDLIIKVNGVQVVTDDQVKQLISENPGSNPVKLVVKRGERQLERIIIPQYCQDTKSYRIGLFIRDNAGGVGTLTFYDPYSKKYGALGHVITDSETNQKLSLRQGKILEVSVEGIQQAQRGNPGEKVGVFLENSELGNIQQNESCGIYGQASKEITNKLYPQTIPVGYSNQIHTGPAQILTVIKGQEISRYDIEIEKIMFGRQDGKNMVLHINDPKLIQAAGGIVQGMSGSPIIQDGRIIGAVTHVFVNDPSRGYGVFIENMLLETGILKEYQTLGSNSQGLFILAIYLSFYTYINRFSTIYNNSSSKKFEKSEKIS